MYLLLQLKRVSSDLDNLNECRSRQRDQIEAKERHLAEAMERERQATVAAADYDSQAREAREQLRRMTSMAAERDSRFSHEVKRRDNEIAKLKERLLKLLGDKSHVRLLHSAFAGFKTCQSGDH